MKFYSEQQIKQAMQKAYEHMEATVRSDDGPRLMPNLALWPFTVGYFDTSVLKELKKIEPACTVKGYH